MRVIRNNDEIEIPCPKCESVLGVVKDDIKDDDQSGPHIFCAVCDRLIYVPMSVLPTHWLDKIG